MPPSSRGLGHLPFTEVTGIRIPLGVLIISKETEKSHVYLRNSTYSINSVGTISYSEY